MADHWIPAAKAYALTRSAQLLCTRLHAGLVQARASLLTIKQDREKREHRNAAVPASFWWAEGHEALHQSWEKGDFSTWIDHRIHLQAFGVTFALGGILEMLPLERRALVARELSVASNKDWISASRTHELVLASGVEPDQATLAIIREATFGFLTARAVMAEGTSDGAKPETWKEREWDLPAWFWAWLPANGTLSWQEGYVRSQGRADKGFQQISASGVHFLTEAVLAAFPQPAPISPVAPRSSGGRPPAEFTDDLWSAISGQIFRGELATDKKSVLAKAMQDWAAAHGHELSDTAAKVKARKLFDALNKE